MPLSPAGLTNVMVSSPVKTAALPLAPAAGTGFQKRSVVLSEKPRLKLDSETSVQLCIY